MSIRHDNFIKFAEERMTRIFQTMNLISNLSTVARYTYSKEEVDELFFDYFRKGKIIKELFYQEENDYKTFDEELIFSFCSLPIPANRSNEKFRKLATQRLNNVYKNLQLISNLRNRKNYTYSLEEVDALFSAYTEKGLEIKRCFEPNLEPLVESFSFKNIF